MKSAARRMLLLLALVGGILIWSALVFTDGGGENVVRVQPGFKRPFVSFNHSTSTTSGTFLPVFKKHPLVENTDCSPFFLFSIENPERVVLDSKEKFKADCDSIFSRHYFAQKPLSQEEADFPIAIARVVYRDYYFLEQMLALQYSPQNSYCFALDKKADEDFKMSIRSLASCFPNVYVPETEYDIDNLGHNMNLAHWECVKEIRNVSWNYLHFMQNHDIPLRTNLETVRILKIFNGSNDVEFGPFPKGERVSKDSSFTFESLKLFKNETLNTNETLKLAKGGVQSAFSRAAIDFMLSELNVVNLLTELNKGGRCVDETFSATIQTDPTIALPGGSPRSCVDKGKKTGTFAKKAVWYNKKMCKSGNMRHSVCVFGVEDLPNVVTFPHAFLNKMLPEFDYLAFSCLAERIFRKAQMGELDLNITVYENSTIGSC
ncbi:hypothetical protein L596_014227 [Steinernema carpocapsae]|uniref:Uncharacterized protein n=1 Tax=Steinernema carpocapsae TaxID=34508 RepID=A0A4U5NBH1_STECR|nr:hypothetical protein L596_014227 [Steinernema carpocapsae]